MSSDEEKPSVSIYDRLKIQEAQKEAREARDVREKSEYNPEDYSTDIFIAPPSGLVNKESTESFTPMPAKELKKHRRPLGGNPGNSLENIHAENTQQG